MTSTREAMYEFSNRKQSQQDGSLDPSKQTSCAFDMAPRDDTMLTILLPPSGLPVCHANRAVLGGQWIHRAVRGA
eukprot:scaffold458271_cov38-Prasinocladus_malaysianus.AAC.1